MKFGVLDLTQRAKQKNKKGIPLGVPVSSVVKSVEWAPGYVEGKAIKICYKISDPAGNLYEHQEIFFLGDYNARTREFFNYLAENNVYDVVDFEGCTENLLFLKDVRCGKTFSNICKREFVSASKEEVTDVGAQN